MSLLNEDERQEYDGGADEEATEYPKRYQAEQ
eukprot:CAMPEP_0170451538 /NCGR_PEP_ID=MMETSP0123-20130129/745_1 /TAXON_ID=182087 /ORGANISM="Favella ehrenbergii, Strain Fehren 1" /LENGTH=31 /DNA_ID= /DNA_START= /DNA_END= /DNA_ORIENTATION=